MKSSIIQAIIAEQKKVRHKKIWLIPFGFFSFETIWMLWILSRSEPKELLTGYLMLFYEFPIMNTILLPAMISAIASRLCDMEIKGDTLKLLYTLQKPSGFFIIKYLAGVKYLFCFTLGHGIMILAVGKLFHFGNPLKVPMLAAYLAATLCTCMVLFALQQTLSLLSDSQIMPLFVGLAGSFLGLFSLFFPAPAARLIIWGYFAAFPCVKMNWERTTKITEFYEVPFPLPLFLAFCAAGILIFAVCRAVALKKEV